MCIVRMDRNSKRDLFFYAWVKTWDKREISRWICHGNQVISLTVGFLNFVNSILSMALWNRDFQASLRGLIESVIRPEERRGKGFLNLLLFKEISLICWREIIIFSICHLLYHRIMYVFKYVWLLRQKINYS